jgi:dihydroorotate dehydrogenase (NAD+) catalytic subunit
MKCKINSLELRTPIILSSCDLFVNEKNIKKFYQPYVGAIVLKTTSGEPCKGYNKPHIAKFGDGILVASGMTNPGIIEMCKIVKKLKGIPLIGSLVNPSLSKEYADAGAVAVELNLSCPHGIIPAPDSKGIYSAVKHAKSICNIPIFAKLTGWNCNIIETAKAAQRAGADAIVVSNIFPGTGYYTGIVKQKSDYKIGDYLLGHEFGAYTSSNFLSGVLFMIKQIKAQIDIPIIATGGCCNNLDSLIQSFMSGAIAVETITPVYQKKDLNKLYKDFLKWNEKHKGIINLAKI